MSADFKSLCAEVLDYSEGRGKYNFSRLKDYERDNAAFDAWQDIKDRLKSALNEGEANPKSEPNPIAWCNKEDFENALIKNQSFSGWREKCQDCDTPLFSLDAVLRCKEQIAPNTRYEFSILDADGCEQAGGSAPTYEQALADGRHYLSQYLQDGPHALELRKVEVLPAIGSTNECPSPKEHP